jgi:hypothetical protein
MGGEHRYVVQDLEGSEDGYRRGLLAVPRWGARAGPIDAPIRAATSGGRADGASREIDAPARV